MILQRLQPQFHRFDVKQERFILHLIFSQGRLSYCDLLPHSFPAPNSWGGLNKKRGLAIFSKEINGDGVNNGNGRIFSCSP